MACNPEFLETVRAALSHLPAVAEKKMFGNIAFMVDGKMCITVGEDRIMCRIDPALHDRLIMTNGVETVVMGKKEYRGFIYVTDEAIRKSKDLQYWTNLALDYNKKAQPAKKKKRS